MNRQKMIRRVAAGCAVMALTLVGGSPGVAKSRIPELGNADPPAKAPPQKKRATGPFRLTTVGSGPCGTETYVIEVDGRRLAALC